MTTTIRRYRPEDKPRLREICRATAHRSYCKNAATYAAVTLLYNDYYTENEPENVFVVADEDDRPVGYVLCSVKNDLFLREMKTTYRKRLKAVCPSKLPDALAARILCRLLPADKRVHLHIDILPDYQRMGLGSRLLDALRDLLAAKGIPYLTVLSVSTRSAGYKFYIRYGFSVLRRFTPGEVALTISTERQG